MVNKREKTMYYIVVYDIASPRRLPKILKTCRKYLHWVQRSVFEGELTKSQILALKGELKKIISPILAPLSYNNEISALSLKFLQEFTN